MNYRISVCTVCMNRLHQLKHTLPQNIKDTEDYKNLEFIVLDYNSQDGMEEWIRLNMASHIESGRLVYYKTTEPTSWSPSHSKNIAFKIATGDIICNIWADYYTGAGFARYANKKFAKNNNIVLTPIDFPKGKKNRHLQGDILGKVCAWKADFEKIKGFDEHIDRHGYEDYDFINRLEMIGVKRVLIETSDYLQFISHDNDERFLLPTHDLQGLYVHYCSPSKSILLFLYKNGKFEKGIVTDNFTKNSANYLYAYKPHKDYFSYSLDEVGWDTGIWIRETDSIRIEANDGEKYVYEVLDKKETIVLNNAGEEFELITDEETVDGVLKFKHFSYTRLIMEQNLKRQVPIVNSDNFGKALVYKNFHHSAISI
jgi:Glycosyl transferase family 2